MMRNRIIFTSITPDAIAIIFQFISCLKDYAIMVFFMGVDESATYSSYNGIRIKG